MLRWINYLYRRINWSMKYLPTHPRRHARAHARTQWCCVAYAKTLIIGFSPLLFLSLAWKVLQKLWFSCFSLIFIEFLRFLWIFCDLNGFSVDFHWFSMVFHEFQLIFIDFSSIFIIFKRLCGRIFIDLAWKVLQKLWFSRFSLIFIEFLRFLWIFYDFNGFSVDVHGFSMVFNEFPWIFIDFSSIFIIFKKLCGRVSIDFA